MWGAAGKNGQKPGQFRQEKNYIQEMCSVGRCFDSLRSIDFGVIHRESTGQAHGSLCVGERSFAGLGAETAQCEQPSTCGAYPVASQPTRASAQLGCEAVEQQVRWGADVTRCSPSKPASVRNSCATSLWPSAVVSHAHPFPLALRCIRATSFPQNVILSSVLACRLACTNLANFPKRIHLIYFSKHPRSIHSWQNNTSAASSHWLLISMPSSVRNPPSLPCALIAHLHWFR